MKGTARHWTLKLKKKSKCGKYYMYHGQLSQEWIDRRYFSNSFSYSFSYSFIRF